MEVQNRDVFLGGIDKLATCRSDLIGIADILRMLDKGEKAVDLDAVKEFLASSLDRSAETIREVCDQMQQALESRS